MAEGAEDAFQRRRSARSNPAGQSLTQMATLPQYRALEMAHTLPERQGWGEEELAFHPGGMRDNSPMFQHWGESSKWWSVPKGRQRDRGRFQSSLRDSIASALINPTLKLKRW